MKGPYPSLQGFIWNVRTLGPVTWLRCAAFNGLLTWAGIIAAVVVAFPLLRSGGIADSWLGVWWMAIPPIVIAILALIG